MANTFQRVPQVGGDINVGGVYNEYQLESTLGLITSQLYNDGGALKLKVGRIGIDNGATKGVAILDTVETIDLSGVSNSNWAKIEMAVSGTAAVFTAADIAAATDPAEAPATFKNSYNGLKGGFYIDTAKRCIGLAWKNSSGVLLAVINVCPHINDYWASEIGLHTGTIHKQRGPRLGFIFSIGDWNMDTTVNAVINHSMDAFFKAVYRLDALIRNDADTVYYPLTMLSSAAAGTPPSGGWSGMTSTQIALSRVTNEEFDSVDYDSIAYDRGSCIIYMRDF